MKFSDFGRERKNDLAIFPCFPPFLKDKQFGYSVGWINGEYCFVWGNYKTKEQAEIVLKKEYPEHKIIYFDKENQPYHRWNKPNNDKT